MPIFLCYDPVKRTTPWTEEKHRSMTNEFAKRRIKYFAISSPDELEGYLNDYKDEPSSIVFFPASETQRQYLFDRYEKFNLHPIIFSHHDVGVAASNFSYIMSDFYGDMRLAISHLKEKGCKNIALFCANPDSYHDRMRIETYKKFVENEPVVFTTDSKIYPALTKLGKYEGKLDAIICVNDFVAFCLFLILNKLDSNWKEKISVLSFSDTILSSLCSPLLSSISLNYTDGGKEVATIHRAIEKNSRMAYMHIVMKSMLAARETTKTENPTGMCFTEISKLSEDEIRRIIKPQSKCMTLEKLLARSDETDLAIIHGLVCKRALGDIASRLYLTRDTVKYRVKKFKEYMKCGTTSELADILSAWIDAGKLENMIISKKG